MILKSLNITDIIILVDNLQHDNFRTNIVYYNIIYYYYFQDISKYLMSDPIFCPNNCVRCYRAT